MAGKGKKTGKGKKAANGDGTLRQRSDGRWEGQFVVGYRPDGTLIRRSVYGRTQQEARERLREAEREIQEEDYVEPNRIVAVDWLREWLRVYVIPFRKPSTSTSYEQCINQLAKHLGVQKLQDLKPMHVQRIVNGMMEDGKAPLTVRKAYTILHEATEQAVINGLLKKNPCERTRLPPMVQKDIRVFTREEETRYLETLPETDYGRALRLTLFAGLRAAEAAGLRWCDVDEDALHINQTIRRNRDFSKDAPARTSLQVGTPKSKASRRMIPLTKRMRTTLAAQKRAQAELFLKTGQKLKKDTLVFVSETGMPLDSRDLLRTHQNTLERAGIEKCSIHTLRHSFATRCVESGMDVRTLSEIIGHSQVSLTLQVYVHSTGETKLAAMQALEEAWG